MDNHAVGVRKDINGVPITVEFADGNIVNIRDLDRVFSREGDGYYASRSIFIMDGISGPDAFRLQRTMQCYYAYVRVYMPWHRDEDNPENNLVLSFRHKRQTRVVYWLRNISRNHMV